MRYQPLCFTIIILLCFLEISINDNLINGNPILSELFTIVTNIFLDNIFINLFIFKIDQFLTIILDDGTI